VTAETTPMPPADVQAAARWEDFVDILYAPSAVFARRRAAGVAAPIIVVSLAAGLIFLLTLDALGPAMEAEFARAIDGARAGRELPPEAVERMRSVGETIARVSAFVFMPIMIGLGGALLWGAGRLLGAAQTFGAAVMVAAYAHVPRVLEGVANGLQAVLLDAESLDGITRLSVGPARFLDPDTTSPMLLAWLGPLDLFTLWVTALLAIGLSVTGGISRRRAAVAAAMVWVASAVPRVLGALSRM
jgi:hypothetical protein